MLCKIPGNWTFVIITDREDLDTHGQPRDNDAVLRESHVLRRLLGSLPLVAAILCGAIGGSADQDAGAGAAPGKAREAAATQPSIGKWQSLFDAKSLRGWREVPFYGRGEVRVEKGTIVLGKGVTTGITWSNSFPRLNYEIRLEAARLDGSDFFAGITFPVKDSYCTWINGGWGGSLVGLSSLEGQDASDNETNTYKEFDNGRWYALRLRVTDDRIQAWIDDEEIISVALKGREIGLRPGEMELCVPFGIASWATTGALRKLEYRLLAPPADDAKHQ